MNISTHQLGTQITRDAHALGITDERSVVVLAIGRIAQAALGAEVETLTSAGAAHRDIEAFRSERIAKLNAWISSEVARLSSDVERQEARRALG
jgi:hypothetical protein